MEELTPTEMEELTSTEMEELTQTENGRCNTSGKLKN
jgi:hypothetical protein